MMITHRMIRLKSVKELTGLSTSSIRRFETMGTFPIRKALGGRAVGWRYDEITEWLDNRVNRQPVNGKFKNKKPA